MQLHDPRERLARVEASRTRMLTACDEAGYPDLGMALDAYIQDMCRLNGDEFNALQDLLHTVET